MFLHLKRCIRKLLRFGFKKSPTRTLSLLAKHGLFASKSTLMKKEELQIAQIKVNDRDLRSLCPPLQ